jgi:hypothetical protein
MNFVWDSKNINECVDSIIRSLVFIQEYAHPEFDEETMKQFKKLDEALKKEESKKKKSKKKKS